MPRFGKPDMPRMALTVRLGLPVAGLSGLFLALAPPPHAGPVHVYPDKPLPAHTGGFGEPTCRTCHFDGPLNEPGGRLWIEGWPEAPEPGKAYALTVQLERSGMEQSGFQLAVRTASGAQAGSLHQADARSAVTETPNGVQYLHQTLAGTDLTAPGVASWRFTWHAPADPAPVIVHVVGNAANGDASEFGDAIYADSLHARLQP